MTTTPAPRRPSIEKQDIKVEPAEGGISIAEIFGQPGKYENKTIKIRGKVTKINNGIMGRNWVHLQDGTDSDGKYDLTVTTNDNVNEGEVVTFQGRVALNKDFGAGYNYDVIIEEAKTLTVTKM